MISKLLGGLSISLDLSVSAIIVTDALFIFVLFPVSSRVFVLLPIFMMCEPLFFSYFESDHVMCGVVLIFISLFCFVFFF